MEKKVNINANLTNKKKNQNKLLNIRLKVNQILHGNKKFTKYLQQHQQRQLQGI